MQFWTELFRLKLCSSILPISGWSIETIRCSALFFYGCHWEVWLVTCYPSLDSCILKWTISRYWTCSLVFFWLTLLHLFTSLPGRYIYIYNYIVCWHFFHSSILCFFRFFWFIGGAKQRDGDVSIPRWKPSLLGDVSQCLDSSLVKLEIQEAASIAPPVRMQSLVRMVIRMTEFTRKPFFLAKQKALPSGIQRRHFEQTKKNLGWFKGMFNIVLW